MNAISAASLRDKPRLLALIDEYWRFATGAPYRTEAPQNPAFTRWRNRYFWAARKRGVRLATLAHDWELSPAYVSVVVGNLKEKMRQEEATSQRARQRLLTCVKDFPSDRNYRGRWLQGDMDAESGKEVIMKNQNAKRIILKAWETAIEIIEGEMKQRAESGGSLREIAFLQDQAGKMRGHAARALRGLAHDVGEPDDDDDEIEDEESVDA